VRKHGSWIAVLLVLAVIGGAACKSQQSAEQQKKVDELQAQLEDAKKELAAKEEQAKAAESPPPPAPEPAPAPVAPAKNDTPKSAKKSKAAAGAAAAGAAAGTAAGAAAGAKSPDYLTTEQAAQAKEQYAQDKEKVKGAFEQQAQTNEQVQKQIEELKPREFTLPAGTVIPVRTTTELSTKNLADGSVFDALLEKGIVVDGTLIAPQGAHVGGVVVSSDPGGKVKGVASLEVTIRTITGVKDHTIRVKTNNFSTAAETSKGRDAKRTGILAGAGAVVGAIAGGGKGAAIGAGAGAATGVGANMMTRGKDAVIPAETLIEFTLAAPTTVVVQPQAR
jgi:hypothetical protein